MQFATSFLIDANGVLVDQTHSATLSLEDSNFTSEKNDTAKELDVDTWGLASPIATDEGGSFMHCVMTETWKERMCDPSDGRVAFVHAKNSRMQMHFVDPSSQILVDHLQILVNLQLFVCHLPLFFPMQSICMQFFFFLVFASFPSARRCLIAFCIW